MDNENVNVNNSTTENAETTENAAITPIQEASIPSVTQPVEAPVKPDQTETIPNLNPTDSEGQLKLDKWIAERAKASEDKAHNPVLQPDKVVLINKDNPDRMYALKLHFPGTMAATEIQTKSLNEDGRTTDFAEFMKLAIDNRVVVAPRISNPDRFFNNHVGTFPEAALKVYRFLDEGLTGQSGESED